ncbi:MAG: DUF5317 domain-containing protein [Saccharofermentanales bacterium]
MLFEAFVLAIIIGYLNKGSLQNLSQTPFKGAVLIFGGLILRNSSIFLKLPFIRLYADRFTFYIPIMFLISFVFLTIGVSMNMKHWSMIVVLIGILLNYAVVLLNYGFMPVSGKGLIFAGFDISRLTSDKLDLNHVLITAQTKMSVLSDIIPVPRPYPFPKLISIGDVAICLGLFLYIVIKMSPKKEKLDVDRVG